jgi:hypothetical protein
MEVTNKMQIYRFIYFPCQLYMFREMFSHIIRSTWLYLQYLVVFSSISFKSKLFKWNILVCGAEYIIFILDLCLCLFVLLDLFLFLLGWFCCVFGAYFIISDLVYFIDWNIFTLNSRFFVMTFLFDWMSLSFLGFVFVIASLVILYSGDYIHDVQLKSGPLSKPWIFHVRCNL